MAKKDSNSRPTNYRKLFWLGIVCMVIGLPLGAFILIVLGTFLMIIGWANKHKWPRVDAVPIRGLEDREPIEETDPEEDYDR
jgi:hypothetical protein